MTCPNLRVGDLALQLVKVLCFPPFCPLMFCFIVCAACLFVCLFLPELFRKVLYSSTPHFLFKCTKYKYECFPDLKLQMRNHIMREPSVVQFSMTVTNICKIQYLETSVCQHLLFVRQLWLSWVVCFKIKKLQSRCWPGKDSLLSSPLWLVAVFIAGCG